MLVKNMAFSHISRYRRTNEIYVKHVSFGMNNYRLTWATYDAFVRVFINYLL